MALHAESSGAADGVPHTDPQTCGGDEVLHPSSSSRPVLQLTEHVARGPAGAAFGFAFSTSSGAASRFMTAHFTGSSSQGTSLFGSSGTSTRAPFCDSVALSAHRQPLSRCSSLQCLPHEDTLPTFRFSRCLSVHALSLAWPDSSLLIASVILALQPSMCGAVIRFSSSTQSQAGHPPVAPYLNTSSLRCQSASALPP